MADWSRANGSSEAANTSPSKDLVSPLAIKLQQVWLQTQLRSSSSSRDPGDAAVAAAPDAAMASMAPPGSSSGAAGNPAISVNFTATSPAMAATTPSSSSESGDDSWGTFVVDSRAGLPRPDENPVLQYIDNMLMEEEIDQQACLDLEVSVGAFQAELAELIQTSKPAAATLPAQQVSPNLDWRTDILRSIGGAAGHVAPSPPPPLQSPSFSASSPPLYPQSSSSRRNSPSSPSPTTVNAPPLQRSSSFKKRKETSGAAAGASSSSGHFQMVGFFQRQNLFSLDWNGSNGRSAVAAAVAAAAAAASQPSFQRPPRLILQRNESYTGLWEQMGLRSQLLDRLVLCGEALAGQNYEAAASLAEELRNQAAAEGDATQRVVCYFLQALEARMTNTGVMHYGIRCKARPSIAETLKAVQMIVKHTPFLGLPHLYTNRIILDAIQGAGKVHIVDFGIMYGLQWPALLQLLAERREGPPQLRITGVDLPPKAAQSTHTGRIGETGRRLKKCAQDWGVPFKFKSLSCAWESIEPGMLQIRDDEVLIVSCSFKQTNLFDGSVTATDPKLQWLRRVRNLNPRVFIQALASSDFAGPIFLQRFQMALVHHAAVFAAMDACISRMLPERRVIEQDKYGREIMNIIACEGVDRVERSETHDQWHRRAENAGFEVIPLKVDLFEEAKAFARGYNRDLTVDRDGEWMWLGWRNQIIHAYSAWRVAAGMAT